MKQNGSRCQMLNEINEISFAVNDLHLYLDTHPCDEEALARCREMLQKRIRLLKEYAQNYGPLTVDSADLPDCDRWKWMEQPFPWEKEGACR